MGWTLQDIQNSVRDITGSPSLDQLSLASLNTFINNYYVYKMPFELKEQVQLEFYDFYTRPGINVYPFSGSFLTDQPGAYADGFPLIFYQDPDVFYQDFPQQYVIDNLAAGNGSSTAFSGGLQSPPIIIGTAFFTDGTQILQDNGTQSTTQVLATGNGSATYTGALFVYPIFPGSLSITNGIEAFVDNGSGSLTGSLGGFGTIAYQTGVYAITFASPVATGITITASYTVISTVGVLSGDGAGFINYQTGEYGVTFAFPPAAQTTIYAKYQGYQPNRPQGVLFFKNQFTFMPVPDQVYKIRMQGYINPNPLQNPGDVPTLPEWGALIAYGASLDIFSSRGDMDNYDRYFPVFKRMENIALARTVQQFSAEQSVERF